MYKKHYVGLDLTGFEDRGRTRPVSRVTLLVDDGAAVTAGDDTGLELTANCPHATQAMADAILASLRGYAYSMYSATAANLDPASELGDGVTAGGLYALLARIEDGGSGYPDLEAPGQAELEDEFPTEGPLTGAFNRKIAQTRAAITKTAEDITLSVQNTAEELRASIQANADNIALRVEKSGVISAINQSPEQISIQAEKISLEGLVTVNKTFQIDRDGYLRCSGGTVGGFTVGQRALYNGLASFGGAENGVYIGTDGISLGGGKFKVDSLGNLTASSGTFTGTVYANRIQAGGDAGYITGGQIGSATIGGGNIASHTVSGGNIAQSTVTGWNVGADTITRGNLYEKYATSAQYNAIAADVASIKNVVTSGGIASDSVNTRALTCYGGFTFLNKIVKWKTVYIDGEAVTVMAQ